MTDKLQSQIDQARKAEALREQETLRLAFRNLEADYLKAWGATHPNDTAGRERLWSAVQILGDVQRHLSLMISAGKIAQSELDKLIRMQEQKRR